MSSIKEWIVKQALNAGLKLIKLGWNYMDKDKDGKVSYEEFEETAKDLNKLTKQILTALKK